MLISGLCPVAAAFKAAECQLAYKAVSLFVVTLYTVLRSDPEANKVGILRFHVNLVKVELAVEVRDPVFLGRRNSPPRALASEHAAPS